MRYTARILLPLIVLLGLEGVANAQAQPAAPAPASAPNPASPTLKAEELDALVAQVALYPDTLLANVLMASTYPLEVIEASRWAKANKNLKGKELSDAVVKQGWDDSVKALTATPSVLDMMSDKLDWTQKIGDAVLAQQVDVMDAVQRMRARAQAQDKLKSTKEQKVSTKSESNKQVIVIEPAQPEVVYVPYYDPRVVYGAWPYPAYPPYYYPWPPAYYPGAAVATGIAFGVGVAVGAWASHGWWGAGFGWGNNNININRSVNINNINVRNNNWAHNPAHRQGVRYNNTAVAQKFANNNIHGGAQNRIDFRGRDGNQVIRPDGNRPGQGARPNHGDRPNPDRRGDRPRGGGADRHGGAFAHVNEGGHAARLQSDRGRGSLGARGGGGGQFRGGGGGLGGGGFGGGHRR